MKLYRARNGFIGFTDVHCYVVAEDEERAKELAREAFKKEDQKGRYGERYYSNINVEEIFSDCSKENASSVFD